MTNISPYFGVGSINTQCSSPQNPGERFLPRSRVLAITKIHCGCNHSTGYWSFSLDVWMFGYSAGRFDTFFVFFMRGLTSTSYHNSHKIYKKKCQTLQQKRRKGSRVEIQTETSTPSRMVASTMDLCNRQHFSWITRRRTLCLPCYCVAVIQWRSRNSWRAEIWNPFCLLDNVHTCTSTYSCIAPNEYFESVYTSKHYILTFWICALGLLVYARTHYVVVLESPYGNNKWENSI